MNPIVLILYIVIVTLLLTLAFPRLRQANPAQRQRLWLLLIAGGIAFLTLAYLVFRS